MGVAGEAVLVVDGEALVVEGEVLVVDGEGAEVVEVDVDGAEFAGFWLGASEEAGAEAEAAAPALSPDSVDSAQLGLVVAIVRIECRRFAGGWYR